MKAHELDSTYPGFKEPEFELSFVAEADGNVSRDILETCSYCGSMTIDDVVKYMRIPGTTYGGSDWKYGWPHKFYIDIPCAPYERLVMSKYESGKAPVHERRIVSERHHKFYSTHLRDATPEQLAAWNSVVAPLLGVAFDLHPEKGLGYRALCHGYQTHGVVA